MATYCIELCSSTEEREVLNCSCCCRFICLTKSLCLGKDVVANQGYTMELVCRVGVWEILFSLDSRGRPGALGCNLEVSLLL